MDGIPVTIMPGMVRPSPQSKELVKVVLDRAADDTGEVRRTAKTANTVNITFIYKIYYKL